MAEAASFRQAAQDSVVDAGIFICQNELASHTLDPSLPQDMDIKEINATNNIPYTEVLDAQALHLIAIHGGSHFMAAAFDANEESNESSVADQDSDCESIADQEPQLTHNFSTRKRSNGTEHRGRNINKLLRMQGKEYYGARKTENGYELVLRGKKIMGPPCDSSKCRMSRNTRFCYLFSEDERVQIFNEFWNMSWDSRKAYVKSFTVLNIPKRRSTPTELSRKQFETQFYLPKGTTKHQVCKFTFASTLGVKSSVLQHWTRNDSEAIAEAKIRAGESNPKEEPARALLKTFISWLPEFQSQNVPPTQPFQSKRHIYSCYRTHAESKGVTPLSWPVFLAGLNESRDALLKKLSAEQAEMAASSTAQLLGETADVPQSKALNLSSEADNNTLSDQPANIGEPLPFKCGNIKPGNEKKERKDRRINKLLRMQGKEYFGERKTETGYELVLRGKKVMGKPCDSSKCKMSKKTRFCYLFTEEDRRKLFNDFWKMTWDRRKLYVKAMTTLSTPKRRSKDTQAGGRKQLETQFFLIKGKTRHQVCKFTFLSTLGVKDWALRSWARSEVKKNNLNKTKVVKIRESKIDAAKTYLINFLILLSNIPNQQPFKSKRQVYGCYKTHAESQETPPLSWPTFLRVFNEAQLPLVSSNENGSTQVTNVETDVSVSEIEPKFDVPELCTAPTEWHSQLPFSWTAPLSNQDTEAFSSDVDDSSATIAPRDVALQ